MVDALCHTYQVLRVGFSGGAGRRQEAAQGSRGRAVQVDPMIPTLKAPGTERLKLKCEELLSKNCFKIQLAALHRGDANQIPAVLHGPAGAVAGHPAVRQGLALVHYSV